MAIFFLPLNSDEFHFFFLPSCPACEPSTVSASDGTGLPAFLLNEQCILEGHFLFLFLFLGDYLIIY